MQAVLLPAEETAAVGGLQRGPVPHGVEQPQRGGEGRHQAEVLGKQREQHEQAEIRNEIFITGLSAYLTIVWRSLEVIGLCFCCCQIEVFGKRRHS